MTRLWVTPLLPEDHEFSRRCYYFLSRKSRGLFRRSEVMVCAEPADNLVCISGMWLWRCDEHHDMSNDFGRVNVVRVRAD